jgi:hypothetical protein
LRFAHVQLLWADEDYHLAAALQMLHGKVPYRDFWYDKPPLAGLYYTLIGGYSGWMLTALDSGYVLVACYFTLSLARAFWGAAEGWTAAVLIAFFMAFYLPSAVIPFAADAVMLVPHLAAMCCARQRRPMWAGFWSGIAFCANAKALFVLLACGIWLWPEVVWLTAGFLALMAAASGAAWITGAWNGYVEQVWLWGIRYASGSPVLHPVLNGLTRTMNWLGFHAALAIGGFFGFMRTAGRDRWQLASWMIISFAAVCLGSRFAPHYFLQLLPAIVVAASRGIVVGWREMRKPLLAAVAVALLVPLIRFGPRYATLARDDFEHRPPHWADVQMDLDSREVAREVKRLARPGDSLFVWGYRPDVYVYTRMIPPGLFSDSQPLTGVPADRHLSATTAIYSAPAAANRRALVTTAPTFIVDGLGLLNPRLAPHVYPDLRSWLEHYELVGRTHLSLIYRRVR